MATKICWVCKQEKELLSFSKDKSRKDGINPACKICDYKRSEQRYNYNRKMLWEHYKKNPCVDCGETDPLVLELDHVSGIKKENVSKLIGKKYSTKTVVDEMSKCVVRCANCHRRKTAKDQNWYKDLM
jgi:hypothetical protein